LLDHLEGLYPQAQFTTVYGVVDNYGIHKAKAVERWLVVDDPTKSKSERLCPACWRGGRALP